MSSDKDFKNDNDINISPDQRIEENKDIKDHHEEDIIETCPCGHNRHHHLVTPSATYTAWATFWITIMGVSATPIRVDFICRVCKEKFDFEIDPERLKDFY